MIFVCETCGVEFSVRDSDRRIKDGKVIRYCSKKCMGIGFRSGATKKCEWCGKDYYISNARADTRRFCSRKCVANYRASIADHKPYIENGYVIEHHRGYNAKGNAKQHRLIVEEYLGRKLKANEIVHHVNGIKTDNRIENLQVMTRGEHSRLHRMQEIENGKRLFQKEI